MRTELLSGGTIQYTLEYGVGVLDNWAFWIYFAAWLPFALFVILYARSPWRSSAVGRGLMTVSASIVAVLTNALAALLLGPAYPLRGIFSLELIGATAVAGWYQLKNLLASQRSARQKSRTDA